MVGYFLEEGCWYGKDVGTSQERFGYLGEIPETGSEDFGVDVVVGEDSGYFLWFVSGDRGVEGTDF